MMDFNDVSIAALPPRDTEREEIRAALLAKLESVLFTLFPAGKKRHGTFLIGDILGSPGDSLEVVLTGEKAGLWTDRADNSGGDIYALIGGHYGIDPRHDFPRVLDRARDLVGRAPAAPSRRKAKKQAPTDELGRGHRQVGLPRCRGQAARRRLSLRPARRQEGISAVGCQAQEDGAADPAAALSPAGTRRGAASGAGRGREVRAGADRRRRLRHHRDARRQRAGRQDRLVAAGRQGGADLAGQRHSRAGTTPRAPRQALLQAGATSCAILYPPDGQARGLGCGRCPR